MSNESPRFGAPGATAPASLLRFSWIIDSRLAVGAAPRDYRVLKSLGFSAAVNLQERSEEGPAHEALPADFEFVWIPVRDGIVGGVPTVDQIRNAAESLDRLMSEGHTIYVHCFAGVGRSPMACIAFLARFRAMSLEEASKLVLERHLPADPTNEQLEMVERYLAHE